MLPAVLMPSLPAHLVSEVGPQALFRKSPVPTVLLDPNASFDGCRGMLNHLVYLSALCLCTPHPSPRDDGDVGKYSGLVHILCLKSQPLRKSWSLRKQLPGWAPSLCCHERRVKCRADPKTHSRSPFSKSLALEGAGG